MRIVVGGIAMLMLLWLGSAIAQPMHEAASSDSRVNGAGSTQMPVSGPNATEVMSTESSGSSTAPASVPLEQPIDPRTYICGSGDTFELNFWGQQNFRLKIAADLEGRVFITKVGFVSVAGKTLSSVREEVGKKVRATYPGLRFELSLITPRAFLVHVADNVARPGVYSAHPLERVSAVLARAGGPTGSRRRIQLKHKAGGTTTADLVMYELTGDTKYNPYVLDGDVITVPFPGVIVSISGAVRRPGTYELIKTKDLSELFELAGGFTSTVVRKLPVRVVKRNKAQQAAFVELAFKDATPPNRALDDQDRVVVRGSDELQRSVQIIGAVVGSDPIDSATTAKRLEFIEGDTVLSLLDRAGGIKAPGDLKRSYITRRKPNNETQMIAIDLEALLVRRDFRADKQIQMGDTIVIPAMQYSVLVEGAVTRAGPYPYNPLFSISEYIARAGGRTRLARDLSEVKITDPNGKTRTFEPDLKLHPGDSILVPERNWSRPEIVQLIFAGAGLIISTVALTYAVTR